MPTQFINNYLPILLVAALLLLQACSQPDQACVSMAVPHKADKLTSGSEALLIQEAIGECAYDGSGYTIYGEFQTVRTAVDAVPVLTGVKSDISGKIQVFLALIDQSKGILAKKLLPIQHPAEKSKIWHSFAVRLDQQEFPELSGITVLIGFTSAN